jgi:hypothetical protein
VSAFDNDDDDIPGPVVVKRTMVNALAANRRVC